MLRIHRMLPKIQKVAILGGGPSGAATAKCLLAEGLSPVIFEQRSTFGGVWNYTPQTKSKLDHVPLEDPNIEDEPAIERGASDSVKPVIMSPIYAALETNIPKDIMTFNNTPFDSQLQLFPKHEDVNKYIQEYSKDLSVYAKFNTRVVGVTKSAEHKWKVKAKDLCSESIEESIFDAVVIATGHYIVPYIPPIPGIKEFEDRFPGSIQHSKYFRTPERYTGKSTIVVGNSASGIDIAMQISQVAHTPFYQSVRSTDGFKAFPGLPYDKMEIKPPIAEFNPDTQTVVFQDGSEASDIDIVLFCTGYLHSLPFLTESGEPSERIITDGFYMHRLYQHLFYIPDPTLAIVGLPTKVIPFPVTECQAAVLAGVYSGRLSLPSVDVMNAWEQDRLLKKGGDRHFHFLSFPNDAEYMDFLYEWNKEGKDTTRALYQPSKWGERERAIRKNLPALKLAFFKAKQEGRIVKTMEELGFTFD